MLFFALLQPSSPVMINIEQKPEDEAAGLADVLIGSLGLTGVIVLIAIVAAAIFGAGLIWFRSRSPQWTEHPEIRAHR